jgi:MurNAc alpha-1-phosphate uridylyltransferase
MILAAGRGERLRPVTDDLPKPLVAPGGVTLLERHLARLADAGIDRVVINLGWHGDKIVEHIGSGERFGLAVSYSPEYDDILETGGGITRALPMLGDDPFWVVNGDIYTDTPLPKLALPADRLGHLVLVPTPAYKPRGDFDLVDGLVRNGNAPVLTFSGIACYRPALFAGRSVERFSLVPLLRDAADAGRLGGELWAGAWTDVGTPERLAELDAQLKAV